MVSVDPAAISFLKPLRKEKMKSDSEASIEEVEETTDDSSGVVTELNTESENASTIKPASPSEDANIADPTLQNSSSENETSSSPHETLTETSSSTVDSSNLSSPKSKETLDQTAKLTPFNLPKYASPFIFPLDTDFC